MALTMFSVVKEDLAKAQNNSAIEGGFIYKLTDSTNRLGAASFLILVM